MRFGIGVVARRVFRLMASLFLLLRQKKETKEKATPLPRPSGSRIEANGRALHQLALTDCTKRSLSRSSNTVPLLSRPFTSIRRLSKGNPEGSLRAAEYSILAGQKRWCIRWIPFYVAEKRSYTGRKGAACLSSAARGVLCPVSGRVAAPPRVASIAGKPKADIVGVAFLWLLSLAKQRK